MAYEQPWLTVQQPTTRKRAKGPVQRYQLLLQPVPLVPMVPAATAAGIFGLGPTPWRTIGTGWRYKPVPMRQHRNRFVPPPGAKCRRRYRHWLVGPTDAYCAANGTGSCHDPVLADARARGTGLCLDPVLLNNI